jgi:vacuolar-type H+-ATPase subunit I/STV1
MTRTPKNDLEEAVDRFKEASDSLERVTAAALALESSAEREKKALGSLADAVEMVAEVASGLGEVSNALRATTESIAAVTTSAKTVIDASDVQQVENKLELVLRSTGEVAVQVVEQMDSLGSKVFEEIARVSREFTAKQDGLSQELAAVSERLGEQQVQLARITASMPDRWKRRSAG